MARAKETILTLVLLSLIILGMMYVVAALIDRDRDSIDRIFRKLDRSSFSSIGLGFFNPTLRLQCWDVTSF